MGQIDLLLTGRSWPIAAGDEAAIGQKRKPL